MQQPTHTVYYITFAVLLLLLASTVGASFLELGAWAPATAVTIAFAKAVLIVLFFMHVRYEVSLVRVFSVAGILWLTLLLALLLSDYLTRELPAAEMGASPARVSGTARYSDAAAPGVRRRGYSGRLP